MNCDSVVWRAGNGRLEGDEAPFSVNSYVVLSLVVISRAINFLVYQVFLSGLLSYNSFVIVAFCILADFNQRTQIL